jgi:DNA processing protein
MTPLESAVLLNLVPEVGPARFRNFKNHFGSLSDAFASPVSELKKVEGITDALARKILSFASQRELAEKEMELSRQNGIRILTVEDEFYPSLLRTIANPPQVLYCRGRVEIFNEPSIALVGSRRPTSYGEQVAERFSRDFTRAGLAVVSGLARGIDTAAHRGALKAQGKTAAVLGSGLLRIYPPENRRLADAVAESGLVASEFPLHSPPDSAHFPQRNRIISGLSLGTVVVEAQENSGALITARFAAEQGRDVFAVPGPVTSRLSAGPHRLIKEGAKLSEKAEDVLEEIEPLIGRFFCGSGKEPVRAENFKEDPEPDLSSEERSVLDIFQMGPLHIDFISARSRLGTGKFSEALLGLEMKGAVKSLPGKMYVRS